MMINFTQAALALVEGFGLAFSPCILPILPLILAASLSGNRLRPLLIVAGFIGSFSLFSLASRQLLAATGIEPDRIQFFSYFLLLSFGIVMLVPVLENKFAALTGGLAGRAHNLSSGKLSAGPLGALLVGALIGLVWTPCAGPILAVALLQVIQAQTNLDAVFTILAFSTGAGLPMLLIAYFGHTFTGGIRFLARHTSLIRRMMGVVIVIFAVMGLMGFNIGEWVVTRAAVVESLPQTAETSALKYGLASPYAAPEITDITQWFNTDPLNMASLKGKVVLIDFWTYSCINCIRTFPYIKSWHEKYKDDGFVVIGVHAPEFAFEGKPENVAAALEKFGITYPVAMDNDFTTWKAYKNRYWPAHYLIDRDGNVVYTHFGEGKYDVTEHNIRHLLNVKRAEPLTAGTVPAVAGQTPETYLGTARARNEAPAGQADIPLHHWQLKGSWRRSAEHIESTMSGDALALHFRARKVFLVMESADGTVKSARITTGGESRTIDIGAPTLYDIVLQDSISENTVTIEAQGPGLRLFAFTFES